MVRRIGRAYVDAFRGLPVDVWKLSIGLVINRAGTMVLPFLSLYLVERLALPAKTASGVLVAFGVGSVVGSYLGGELSGRLGPIRVQRISLMLSGVAFYAIGQVRDPVALAATVFVASVVADAYRPACMTAVVECSPPDLQPRTLGLMRLAANLGMAIGPAAGGFLAAIDYAWLFVGDAATCWAAGIWLFLSMRRIGPVTRDAAARSAERRRALLRDGPFLGLLAVAFALATIFFQVFYTLPLYLKQGIGLDERMVGAVFAFNALLIAATEMVLIRRLEHRDPGRLLAVGIALVCLGLGATAFASGAAVVLLTVTVWTVGEMLSLPFSNVLVARRGGEGGAGPAMGLYTAMFSLAAIAAPAVGLFVYDRIGPAAPWIAVAIAGVPLTTFALWLGPRLRGAAPDAVSAPRP